MSGAEEANGGDGVQFAWGKKRGFSKDKCVQFFGSFTYDGVEYALYDHVFLFKHGIDVPFVGKIVKIWETKKRRRIKVHWLFRPSEIAAHLDNVNPASNELFLAAGDGPGASNVNELEAIGGKCYVICTSKDERNPQPSPEDLKNADYIFYRTFDVGSLKVSDKIEDSIQGVEVKFFFNRPEDRPVVVSSETSDKKEDRPVVSSEASGKKDDRPVVSSDTSDKKEDKPVAVKQDKKEDKPVVVVKLDKKEDKPVVVAKQDKKEDKPVVVVKQDKKEDKPVVVKQEENKADGHGKAGEPSDPSLQQKSQSVVVESPLDNLDDRPLKKAKVEVNQQVKTEQKAIANREKATDSGNRVSDKKIKTKLDENFVGNNKKVVEKGKVVDGSLKKSTPTAVSVKDSMEVNKRASDNLQLDNKQTKRLEALKKPLPDSDVIIDTKVDSEIAEVSRRPETDRSKWFADLPWDSKIKNAYDQDKLVMLDNLDPDYSQAELEDLFYQLFKQNCSVRLIEQSSFSNPHHGQALVIFKTSDAANQAVERLNKDILMLPNGRPLIATKGITRSPDQKTHAIIGMLSLEKYTKQRKFKEDQRKAAFASHYSQGNTIEFEMAIEWMLLDTKSKSWWEELHEANRQEIKKLTSSLTKT